MSPSAAFKRVLSEPVEIINSYGVKVAFRPAVKFKPAPADIASLLPQPRVRRLPVSEAEAARMLEEELESKRTGTLYCVYSLN